jgi:hypothetical protein
MARIGKDAKKRTFPSSTVQLAGTSASAIARLEDADYTGHSLSLLKRVASALDKRIEIRFLP